MAQFADKTKLVLAGARANHDFSTMKRIRITHQTQYFYHSPVTFGDHRAMLRPREGHDLHIVNSKLRIEPAATVNWVRDFYGNSIAVLTFREPSKRLSILSEVTVDLYAGDQLDCPIKSFAKMYPFQYAADEQVEIILYRVPSYPHDGRMVLDWIGSLYTPGQLLETWELLNALNFRIYDGLTYRHREEHGVQLPCETLAKGSGSCRDYAVLMMEAARHLGFAARFVTGYIQMEQGQHGATHAWTEVYLPGAGWRGFDPTNNKLVGSEHISVAVSREQEKAAPISGAWHGPVGAFDRMDVLVQVVTV